MTEEKDYEVSELRTVEEESKKQGLPKQEQVFSIAKRVRSRLTHLPDPARPPLAFVPGRGFDVVFPFIRLPELRPTLNGDWVQFGSPELEPNLLYWGDNLQIMRTLPSESIDLIYIDPPFFSGEQYNIIWGDANEVRTFNDIWDGGLDTYLIWLNARLWEMRRVLKSKGSIYVHCDWHANHYIKTEMDKIFGYENFRNEIVWKRATPIGGKVKSKMMPRDYDSILYYVKSKQAPYENQYLSYSEQYINTYFKHIDKNGRRYRIQTLGDYSEESKEKFRQQGRIYKSRDGKEALIQYLDESRGVLLDDLWVDIIGLQHKAFQKQSSTEKIGYPTQKPGALLERIIKASSEKGDIVADFFCGGGTTLAIAQELHRRWIGCDISRVAISVTLDRLVKICEDQSGVKSNYGELTETDFQQKLDLVKAKVPDIRLVYVGVYPMDRFKAVNQENFDRFILQCYDARQDTSDEPVTAWRGALEPILVGPADPDGAPDPKQVKAFFEACLKHLRPNTKMKAKVLAWKFSPQLNEYRRQLLSYITKNLVPKGVAMEFDYMPINSQEFRERIIRKYPDASESEFFLRFTQPPIIGDIVYKKMGPGKYKFEAVDTYSTNLDGYLVNCQWDFDYQRGHFAADPNYILGRRENKGKKAREMGRKFEAVLEAKHTFIKTGRHTVACRVQDNLGGEAIKSITLEVED